MRLSLVQCVPLCKEYLRFLEKKVWGTDLRCRLSQTWAPDKQWVIDGPSLCAWLLLSIGVPVLSESDTVAFSQGEGKEL